MIQVDRVNAHQVQKMWPGAEGRGWCFLARALQISGPLGLLKQGDVEGGKEEVLGYEMGTPMNGKGVAGDL